jgi:hypothetical protein
MRAIRPHAGDELLDGEEDPASVTGWRSPSIAVEPFGSSVSVIQLAIPEPS